MLYVQNVSLADVTLGYFDLDRANTVLISITDNNMPYPIELGDGFLTATYYQFLDVDGPEYKQAISEAQAKGIIRWLEFAKRHNKNVLVHCIAGINRSGAVREVAEILGFRVLGKKQGYNAYVKTKLMQSAGLGYE